MKIDKETFRFRICVLIILGFGLVMIQQQIQINQFEQDQQTWANNETRVNIIDQNDFIGQGLIEIKGNYFFDQDGNLLDLVVLNGETVNLYTYRIGDGPNKIAIQTYQTNYYVWNTGRTFYSDILTGN